MKSLTKKALMLALAIAVVCSFAVFAASDITGTSATLGEDGASVAVAYTAPETASQVTILVFKTANGGESTDTVNADPVINADSTTNIVYIDQKANAESLNFSLRSTDGDGTYKVLIGGTGVAEAATAEFVKVSVVEPTTFTISGTMKDFVFNIGDSSEEGLEPEEIEYIDALNGYYAITLMVYNENGDEVANFVIDKSAVDPGDMYGDAPFAIKGLEAGTYTLYFTRPGLADKMIDVTMTSDFNIGDVNMLSGDLEIDGNIDGSDLAPLLALIAKGTEGTITDEEVAFADGNFDMTIDGGDTTAYSSSLAAFNYDSYNAPIVQK